MMGKLEFGLQVGNLEFARYRDVAQEAEGLGFELITCPDHIVHERPGGQYEGTALAYDPFLITAVMSEATKKIQIGQLVLCNLFRHPAITAQSLTSLDRLADGRAIAGMGTGWTETEFRMTGIPFPDIGTRLRMLDEALTCMRSLWTNETTTFAGEFYKFEDAILFPKPVRKPHPPFLLGGSGKGLLRIAAKHAECVNIISDVGKAGQITFESIQKLTDDAFKAKVRFVREEAQKHGRDPRSIRMSNFVFTLAITDSPADGDAIAENVGAMLGVPGIVAKQSPMALIGTPEECVAELRPRARDWEIVQFMFSGGAENM
ncbi:MAG: LLM class flavin-dependent oxidoreductase, partial [Candidatus Binatia bacterium]